MDCAVTDPMIPSIRRLGELVVLAIAVLSAAGCRPSPSSPLEQAAFEGDVRRITTLLRENGASRDGAGALVWAARAGQVAAIAALLDGDVDPNLRDRRQGWTPLMHALHKHQVAAARLLLDRGADPRIGPDGNSAVEMAALDDEADLVKRMLAAGLPRAQRERALDIAVRGGALVDIDRSLYGACKTRSVRVLMATDPSLRPDTSEGFMSSLWWAKRQGCDETVAAVRHADAIP